MTNLAGGKQIGVAVALFFFVVVGVWGVTPAVAHDAVVGGSPADGAVIETTPTEIVLEFSGEPKEGFNTIAITDGAGTVVYRGEPTVTGRNIVLDLPDDLSLAAGDYTIGFQITSSDGHATRGKTSFSIAGTAATSPTSGVVTQQEQQPTSVAPMGEGENSSSITTPNPWVKVGVVVGILVVLMLLVLFYIRSKKASSR